MWPDNETTVDLLGFDYLVDSLEVVLTQPRLLPLTVGVPLTTSVPPLGVAASPSGRPVTAQL